MIDPEPSAVSPIPQLAALAANGEPGGAWPDYRALGLTGRDIPRLIETMVDPDLNTSRNPAEYWMPLHAWRALGQLGAIEAVEPLIELRMGLDDDHLDNDFEEVMVGIGPAALPALTAALDRDGADPIARGAMAGAISAIGVEHTSVANESAALLASRLEHFAEHTAELNSLIIGALLDLRAVQHADVIGRAMTTGPIDVYFAGDWEDVQVELGLLDQRTTPRWWRSPLAPQYMDRQAPSPVHKRNKAKAKAKAKRKAAKASRRRNRR